MASCGREYSAALKREKNLLHEWRRCSFHEQPTTTTTVVAAATSCLLLLSTARAASIDIKFTTNAVTNHPIVLMIL